MDEDLRREIGDILRRDGKVFALKALRTRTGMSLEDALVAITGLTPASNFTGLPGKLLDQAARFALDSPTADERRRVDEEAVKSWGKPRWEPAISRGRDLEKQSYNLCDRSRNEDFSSDEVQDRLRQLCPGFSDEIYGLAYNRGMVDSR